MSEETIATIAALGHFNLEHVRAATEMIDQGFTIAFIARYRKEKTGNMGHGGLLRLLRLRQQVNQLQMRKAAVIESIREQDKLTPDLESQIQHAGQMRVLEDLYLPFKPARRTAGTIAVERGLQPLADAIMNGDQPLPLNQMAAGYIRHDQELHTTSDVLNGALMIVSECYGAHPLIRQRVRDLVWGEGVLTCSRGAVPEEHVKEFRDYFNFSEAIRQLPPHRVLAVNRGERKKALKVSVHVTQDILMEECRTLLVPQDHPYEDFLLQAIDDSLNRLVIPAISREVRKELTEAAECHAMDVFASNLTGMLMTPPVADARVLAIDPGFRTGCKVAALDEQGKLLAETIVYPHEPQCRWQDSKDTLRDLILKHKIELIAIGNGTGCHETEKLLTEAIAENDLHAKYTMVSEAGASVYAACPLAEEEFPKLDPALRAAVSIGRRLQNPLGEFVKVDPRCIGVGLYQHDVDQEMLRARLEEVVTNCVNSVDADANTAEASLLARISGLNPDMAKAIVASRLKDGPFRSRQDLCRIPEMDEFTFTMCAGFLRISGSENPLARTRVHPENYQVAETALDMLGYSLEDVANAEGLPGLRQKLEKVSLEEMAKSLGVGIPTLSDILFSLEHLDYDVRLQSPQPIFKSRMLVLEDLKPGMWLKGTVRNVVDFGAFVDIGVKEDGLVHVSQLSSKYIKNPTDFVHVGQTVDVRIVTIDRDRRRIALSMIRLQEPCQQHNATAAASSSSAASAATT